MVSQHLVVKSILGRRLVSSHRKLLRIDRPTVHIHTVMYHTYIRIDMHIFTYLSTHASNPYTALQTNRYNYIHAIYIHIRKHVNFLRAIDAYTYILIKIISQG